MEKEGKTGKRKLPVSGVTFVRGYEPLVTVVVIYTSVIWTISCWSFAPRGHVKCRERVFHRGKKEGGKSVGERG